MTRAPVLPDMPADLPASLPARPAMHGAVCPSPAQRAPDPDGGPGLYVDVTTINASTSTQLTARQNVLSLRRVDEYWVAFLGTARAAVLRRFARSAGPPGEHDCCSDVVPAHRPARHRRACADPPSAANPCGRFPRDQTRRMHVGHPPHRTIFIPEHGLTVYLPAPFTPRAPMRTARMGDDGSAWPHGDPAVTTARRMTVRNLYGLWSSP